MDTCGYQIMNTKPQCHKRKHIEDETPLPPKKRTGVNFHSIADLMKSDAKGSKNSQNCTQTTPRKEEIHVHDSSNSCEKSSEQSLAQFPNNLPQLHDVRVPYSCPPDAAFLRAHHHDNNIFRPIPGATLVNNHVTTPNERPPSLTPPPTPTPDEIQTKQTKPLDTKKVRTIYNGEQLSILEEVFSRTQYPDWATMCRLARQLGVPEMKIKVWFQNKRARWRRRTNDTSPKSAPATPKQLAVQPNALPTPPGPVVPPQGLMLHASSPQLHGHCPFPFYPGAYPVPMEPQRMPGLLPIAAFPFHNAIPSPLSPPSDCVKNLRGEFSNKRKNSVR